MLCPACRSSRDMVLETRLNVRSNFIKRRRKCLTCGARWNTVEGIQPGSKVRIPEEEFKR